MRVFARGGKPLPFRRKHLKRYNTFSPYNRWSRARYRREVARANALGMTPTERRTWLRQEEKP